MYTWALVMWITWGANTPTQPITIASGYTWDDCRFAVEQARVQMQDQGPKTWHAVCVRSPKLPVIPPGWSVKVNK